MSEFGDWFAKQYAENPGGVADYKGKPILLETKEDQLKKLAKKKSAMKGIQKTKASLEKGKLEQAEQQSSEVAEKPQFQMSEKEDMVGAVMENIGGMAGITDNPFAQAGAGLLGVLQAEQKRKEANRAIEAEAKMAGARGQKERAAIYGTMAQSMRGMLR